MIAVGLQKMEKDMKIFDELKKRLKGEVSADMLAKAVGEARAALTSAQER